MNKKRDKSTLVVGASTDMSRYSARAIAQLRGSGITTYGLGKSGGEVYGVAIMTEYLPITVDTVTLYVSPKHQTDELFEYLVGLRPNRVIFNPGTENAQWYERMKQMGIETRNECTLVLLSTNQY